MFIEIPRTGRSHSIKNRSPAGENYSYFLILKDTQAAAICENMISTL